MLNVLDIICGIVPVVLIPGVICAGVYFRIIKKVPFEKGNMPNIGYFDDLPDSIIPRAPQIEDEEVEIERRRD